MATLPPPAVMPPHADAPEPVLERGRVVRGPDRREGSRNRRRGPGDRRRGRPDRRPVRLERRGGVGDRRSGRPDRRLGGQRRREPRVERAGAAIDPEIAFWAANVLCWAGVTAVALIWGA
jgi:hypothetical protein